VGDGLARIVESDRFDGAGLGVGVVDPDPGLRGRAHARTFAVHGCRPLIAYRRARRIRLYGALLSRYGKRHGIFAGEASTRSERMAARIDLCGTDEVAPGTALKVDTADLAVAVFNLDGEVYVIHDNCTHGPGLLSGRF